MFTNRLFNLFIVSALLLLSVITAVGFASFPGEARGTFTPTSTTIHSVTEEKFNEIVELSSTVTYTGTLEGTSTLQGTLVVHRDGSANFKGVETFTGLVNGMPGSLTFDVLGTTDIYQAVQLTNTITGGTDGLASLEGGLSMVGMAKDAGFVGTYMGQINIP